MNKKDSLGDRMKGFYEGAYDIKLPRRMPVILRLDVKAFTTFTRNCEKPFDTVLMNTMAQTTLELCKNIQGAVFGYTQSDEISILIHNYKKLDSGAWYENSLQKMVSVSASIATAMFNKYWVELNHNMPTIRLGKLALFDSRAYVVPEAEVNNAFLWRQQDATRNSIQMLARSLYSHKECDHKNTSELQEMCFAKGYNWNNLETYKKRGSGVYKHSSCKAGLLSGLPATYDWSSKPSTWIIYKEIPIFSEDKYFIQKFLAVEQE